MPLELVVDGEPLFCLEVSPPQDGASVRRVIGELVVHLEACLRGSVPWFDRWAEELPPVRLILSLEPALRMEREAFDICATETEIMLCASWLRGLDHAVHFCLEEAFDVRWLWPGDSGTVTPRAHHVEWPLGTTRYEPDWTWRRLWVGGSFWKEDDATLAELKFGRVRPATLDALELWQHRNRLGGLNIADGHRWAQICSARRNGRTHPEYFALVNGERDAEYHDGKHGNQPCTSNPDVVRRTAAYIRKQFRSRPELDGFSIAANDGLGFCECEKCRAIDDWAEAGDHHADGFDAATGEQAAQTGHRAITDRMLRFANEVAARVAPKFPKKLLMVLIYSVYRTPPKRVKLHPNVIAQFCTSSWAQVSEAEHQKEIGILDGFRPFTEKVGIYDYFVNGAKGSLPRGFARTFERCLRAYYNAGCRFFATQAGLDFATGGFAYYLAARMLWNMNETADAVLDDYCDSGFGPAADAVRRYLNAFMERWDEAADSGAINTASMESLAVQLYREEWRHAQRQLLDEAARDCEADEEILRRVQFLANGLDFLDLLVPACESILQLIEDGAPSSTTVELDEMADWLSAYPHKDRVRDAIRRHHALLSWVDGHRDGFWIAAMWFDYQRTQRAGLLGTWSDRLAEAQERLHGK